MNDTLLFKQACWDAEVSTYSDDAIKAGDYLAKLEVNKATPQDHKNLTKLQLEIVNNFLAFR